MKLHSESEILNRESGMGSRTKLTIDDFELHGILGEGSYGKVYCAVDKLNQKRFAIKVLDKYHIMKVKLNDVSSSGL